MSKRDDEEDGCGCGWIFGVIVFAVCVVICAGGVGLAFRVFRWAAGW